MNVRSLFVAMLVFSSLTLTACAQNLFRTGRPKYSRSPTALRPPVHTDWRPTPPAGYPVPPADLRHSAPPPASLPPTLRTGPPSIERPVCGTAGCGHDTTRPLFSTGGQPTAWTTTPSADWADASLGAGIGSAPVARPVANTPPPFATRPNRVSQFAPSPDGLGSAEFQAQARERLDAARDLYRRELRHYRAHYGSPPTRGGRPAPFVEQASYDREQFGRDTQGFGQSIGTASCEHCPQGHPNTVERLDRVPVDRVPSTTNWAPASRPQNPRPYQPATAPAQRWESNATLRPPVGTTHRPANGQLRGLRSSGAVPARQTAPPPSRSPWSVSTPRTEASPVVDPSRTASQLGNDLFGTLLVQRG